MSAESSPVRVRLLVLWPDGPRYVDAAQAITWALDSYANNADWLRCLACGRDTLDDLGPCDHEGDAEPVYERPTERPAELVAAIEWLEDQGEVTFGNPMTDPEPTP